ncbi:MAG: hypothetical protein AAGH76_18160 [Pseudomonadota bacterium]
MRKLGLVLSGFLGGLLVAVSAVALVFLEFYPATTGVWVASEDVRLENGSVITAGTEMTVDSFMSEGFVRLSLSVNVEGEALAGFERRTEDARDLKIPYWVEPQ